MKIKTLILLIFVVLLNLVSCKEETEYITVFSGGGIEYSIVYASNASDKEKDLAYAIGLLSEANPGLYSDTAPVSRLEILVGKTNREASAKYFEKLKEKASDTAFHYLVAESEGKIILLSDSEAGYLYLAEYLSETYMRDGSFVIPKNCCDLLTVTLSEYYASDIYKEQIMWQDEEKRYEEEQKQLEEELNRYEEENKMETAITLGQAIEQYKNMAASFNSADFGEYSSDIFTGAIAKKGYKAPTVYPTSGSHPRVLFTNNSLETTRQNLESEENKAAYTRFMVQSYTPSDGKFKALENTTTHNMNYDITANIEAKAFRYALTGEKLYGYQAIYAIKNAILTLNIPKGTLGDATRAWGYVIYIAGCVYDWCYDLMTEEDKAQIIAGVVNILGPQMEIVNYDGTANKAPTAQGGGYGHGSETQLLRDWFTFAIACYDEAPEIYELVAGRLFDDYKKTQDYFNQSGAHWEGSGYGPYRLYSSFYASYLLNRMTDGKEKLFSDDMEKVVITFMHYVRPDNQVLRIGDGWQERESYYDLSGNYILAFLAGNYYRNSYLKSIAYEGLKKFSTFTYSNTNITPIMHLAFNDITLSHVYTETPPLVNKTTFPFTSLTAHSAHNDADAFMVYMTMRDVAPATSHAHMDLGSFQIFYKGALASNSGKYSSWGDYHHMNYSMQSISKNTLLVYNPNLADMKNTVRTNMVYLGGQSISTERVSNYSTYEKIVGSPAHLQCVNLGSSSLEENGQLVYAYLGGDMTKAYDAETVDEVTRYMIAVATGDSAFPFAFVTFDRITSDDASYRKSALIHMQEEPTIDGDFAIITNTKGSNNGKLVVQTVGFDTDYTVIGGEGKEFWLNDTLGNATTDISNAPGSVAEYGWGRIEISPTVADKTNHMLTVMYVTDADNNAAPIKAADISTENLAGASMFGKSILFPKNEKLLTEESGFTLATYGECFIAGVSAGEWNIIKDGVTVQTLTVADGTNLISFTAAAGTYTVKPAN